MRLLLLPVLFALAACGTKPGLFKSMAKPEAVADAPSGPYAAIRPGQRPGETATDTVTPAAMPADAASRPASGALGKTVASLGNAAEPGLWLKTPLTGVAGPGKVAYSGKTVEAQLIPIEGPATAGSRASLQLMQALGAPLTGLPEFTVSR